MFRTFPVLMICMLLLFSKVFPKVNRHLPDFVGLPQLNLLQLIKLPRQALSLDLIKTLLLLLFWLLF